MPKQCSACIEKHFLATTWRKNPELSAVRVGKFKETFEGEFKLSYNFPCISLALYGSLRVSFPVGQESWSIFAHTHMRV